MKRHRFAIGLLLASTVTGCSLNRYSSAPSTEISIDLGNRTSAAPDIGQYDVHCVLVDVRGPGLDPLFPSTSPYNALDLGYNSPWMKLTDIANSGQRTIKVSAPLGRSRLVRILGVKYATPPLDCSSLTFDGHPHRGVFATSPLPTSIVEIGRTTIDIFQSKTATLALSPHTFNLLPSGTHLTVTPTHEFVTGNADPSYSEGTPPSSAAFAPISINPIPATYQSMNGLARYDIVIPVNPPNIGVQPPYEGIELNLTVDAGEVSCSGPEPRTITARTPVSVGLWNEASKRWESRSKALPAIEQDLVRSVRIAGFDMSGARIPVAVGSGTNTDALYVSLRIPEQPSTGCSTIRIRAIGAVLYK